MATITVKDANDQNVALEKPLAPGRAAAAASRPVALSSEDLSVLESIVEAPTPAGTNTIGKVDHTTTGIGHGQKTVASAGTAEPLADSTAAKWVAVQAYRANTAMVAIGGVGVDATAASGTGVTLAAGEAITLAVDNLADVYIDATVSGEGVRFTYGT